MDLICGVPHPVAKSVAGNTVVSTGNRSAAPNNDNNNNNDSAPCCFVTTSDGACGTNPRRVCIAHDDGKCTDITAHHYNERTGAIFGL
jgi:hypothetical protein